MGKHRVPRKMGDTTIIRNMCESIDEREAKLLKEIADLRRHGFVLKKYLLSLAGENTKEPSDAEKKKIKEAAAAFADWEFQI